MYAPCDQNREKKLSVSLCDSTDDDESTITSPKTTMNSVMPSRRK